jgi:hypothetical protein
MSRTVWEFITKFTLLTSEMTPDTKAEVIKAFNAKETRSVHEVPIATYALDLVGINMHMGLRYKPSCKMLYRIHDSRCLEMLDPASTLTRRTHTTILEPRHLLSENPPITPPLDPSTNHSRRCLPSR